MRRSLLAGFSIVLVAALVAAPAPALPPSNVRTLQGATRVLDDLARIPDKGIPATLLADAQGVAIIPRVIKAGFVFGGRGGHGIVVARDMDGNWSDPVFVNLGGASVGYQVGIESTDVVLVFRDRRSLDRLLEGKGKVTLGADAAVAAGPVGRTVAAGTDGRLEAEILSYSRGRGVFAGVSVDGAVIRADTASNAMFRQSGHEAERKMADALKARLAQMSKENPVPTVPPVLGPPVPPPTRP
jgi:lipid-binding SYLF domain-containing protein